MARIRPARPDEIARIQDLENDAGDAFVALGMHDDFPGLEADAVAAAIAAGWGFVATDAADEAVGFAVCEVRDAALYLAELGVGRAWQQQGIGGALLRRVVERATGSFEVIWLTTYRDVPFNAPWYRREGFSEAHDVPPWLARIRAREVAMGADRWPRVVMRRRLV